MTHIEYSQTYGPSVGHGNNRTNPFICPWPLLATHIVSIWMPNSTVFSASLVTIPDHLTCLLRNLYAGQEAAVKTRHGTTDWFQFGRGEHQGCILSHCLFNFYAEYIMRNAWLDESQAGIKISGRTINNLRYADYITLMAERGTKEPLDESERGE